MKTLVLIVGRICLPFSLLIALLLNPFAMISNWRESWNVARQMWDDPL